MLVKNNREIPKEDLDAINSSFQKREGVQTIKKDFRGMRLASGRKRVNEHSFVMESFGGRTLRRQKEVHNGEGQTVIGKKGDKWEDIPADLRGQAFWLDSDFEK